MSSFKLTRKFQVRLIIGITLIPFIISGIMSYMFGPETIINYLGVGNSYMLGFIMGILGGASVFTSFFFFAMTFIIARAGLNPFILGIVAGLGLAIGDSLFYLVGFEGRTITKGWFRNKIDNFNHWLKGQSLIIIMVVIFVYVALTPFPNGLLMISTGLAHYRFRTVFIGVLVGDIFFVTLLGVIATNTINYLFIIIPTFVILFSLLIIDKLNKFYSHKNIN